MATYDHWDCDEEDEEHDEEELLDPEQACTCNAPGGWCVCTPGAPSIWER